MLATGSCPS